LDSDEAGSNSSLVFTVSSSGTIMTPTSLEAARETCHKIAANISKIMRGQAGPTRKLIAALASGGRVLLEDFPGTGNDAGQGAGALD
jgi:hypothetical protein